MPSADRVDVVIAGGGIAGSLLAGVLARSGVSVLVAEKEERFRDRVRGETMWPWGVAEAHRLGVESVFEVAGGVSLLGIGVYEDRKLKESYPWAPGSVDGLNEVGFPHARLQEELWRWAQSQGATAVRPVKVLDCSSNGALTVSVTDGGRERMFHPRLVVGADGKMSKARHWTGGRSAADPEHHRFGGVMISGVHTEDRDTDNVAGPVGEGVNWFAQGADTTRLYLDMTGEKLHAIGADRSFDAVVAYAAGLMPEGALDEVRQEGPMGFFANNDTWATRIAGNNVALVGDAAGSLDPSQGHGTALAFRDVRELSDLLLSDDDWPSAILEYAGRRRTYFDVLHQYDLWCCVIYMTLGSDADRCREGHERAEEADPSLGGFGLLEARGPDGLVADESARAAFFGESIP